MGRIISFLNTFNKCPQCKKGNVFKGFIKIEDNCEICGLKFESDKIGDGAAWITTFVICFLVVPILFYFEINYVIKIKFYLTIIFPLILISIMLLLRIFRYVLLKKYYELT